MHAHDQQTSHAAKASSGAPMTLTCAAESCTHVKMNKARTYHKTAALSKGVASNVATRSFYITAACATAMLV